VGGSSPLIAVLSLQGDVREHERSLSRSGARTIRIKTPAALDGIDGLVIPGGESTTIGKLAARFDMIDPIRNLIAQGLPVYGSCAGMIMVSNEVVNEAVDQPLIGGLDIVVRRNAFGPQVASFEAPVEIPVIGAPPFAGVFIRAPWVEKVGAGVEILAYATDLSGIGRIVAVKQRNVLATSFHPELTGDDRLHSYFVSIVKGQA